MAHSAVKLPACANCGYPFPPDGPDEFCPRCGQQNHEVNIGFGHIVEETLEGLFHFDGKVFRTAQLLLFQPGVLTRRFLAGQRVPYVPPIRLYVFLSFVFFFLISAFSKPEHGKELRLRDLPRQTVQAGPDKLDTDSMVQQMTSISALSPTQRDSLRRKLKTSLRQAIQRKADAASGKQRASGADAHKAENGVRFSLPGIKFSWDEINHLPTDPSPAQIDSILRSKGATPDFWNRLSVKRAIRWHDVTQEEAIHQLLRGLSILIFLIMPLAALLLKGVYFRQRHHYISHLIFTVHVHCFLFVYCAVVFLLSQLGFMAWASDYVLLIPAIYLLIALHNFYQQSWLKTVLKSLLLVFSYSMALSFATVVVLGLGLVFF